MHTNSLCIETIYCKTYYSVIPEYNEYIIPGNFYLSNLVIIMSKGIPNQLWKVENE